MRFSVALAVGLQAYFMLSGASCTSVPAPTVKVAARCMEPVQPIPRPELGEGAKAYAGRLIEHSKAEGSKERCLQRYAKRVTE